MNLKSKTSRPPRNYVHETFPTGDDGYSEGSGRLFVESNFSGARITVDGQSNPKWVTPRLFSLAAGTHVVSVSRAGAATWTRRVYVHEGGDHWLVAQLEDGDQDTAIFTVDTDPPGMQVFIDGRAFGPSRVESVLRPGWHVCEVIPGQGLPPLVRRFQLKPGEALTRRIRIDTPAARR
jgi:hypothetical protein